jgi:hypothetical protein
MKNRSSLVLLSSLVLAALASGCATAPVKRVAAAPATPAPVAPVTPPPPAPVEMPPAVVAPPATMEPEVRVLVEHFTQPGNAEAVAHDLVDTTRFPEALASLAPGAQAPKTYTSDSRSRPPTRGLTADGDSTELIERDWTGLVLVPTDTAISTAHTTAVRLVKIEAHPLKEGQVRVWIRMQNLQSRALKTEIACAFQMQGAKPLASPWFYEIDLPERDYRDVFFVSPAGRLNTYTVLVRPTRM